MAGTLHSRKCPSHALPLWSGRRPILSSLDIELTERCNMDCRHCYINLPAHDAAARRNELHAAAIKDILRQAASLGCLDVCFTGGEPLLRDDFEEIYLYARKTGLRVMLVTNATLVTPSLAKLLQSIPPLRKIEVSVYGMDRESYESVSRTPGSFAAFQKGIDLLLEHNVPFIARAAMFPLASDKLRAFEQWASRIPWMEGGPASTSTLHLRCRGEFPAKNARIRTMRLSPSQWLAVEASEPEKFAQGLRAFCSRFCRIPGAVLFGCGAGMGKASLDAYGNLQPCLMLRHPQTVYDLKKGSLEDAVVRFFPRVRRMEAADLQYLERCGRCFLRSLCEQCPATSWMETRSLDGWLEYFCELTHHQARFIGLLEEGEVSWKVADWQERVRKMRVHHLREERVKKETKG